MIGLFCAIIRPSDNRTKEITYGMYRMTHQVFFKSTQSLYCNGTFGMMSTKACSQGDRSPCMPLYRVIHLLVDWVGLT